MRSDKPGSWFQVWSVLCIVVNKVCEQLEIPALTSRKMTDVCEPIAHKQVNVTFF